MWCSYLFNNKNNSVIVTQYLGPFVRMVYEILNCPTFMQLHTTAVARCNCRYFKSNKFLLLMLEPRSTLFRFCVKFYPPDPALLQEEYTRLV